MSNQLKVLIVDDSSFSRAHLSKLVTLSGHQLMGEAMGGAEALQLLKTLQVNVVVTDIVMPQMTGIELTAVISKSYPHVEVIVVSSLSQEHIVLEAISAGAMDFIPKPVTLEQMNDSLNKIAKLINED